MKNHLEKLAAFFDNKKMNSYKKEVVKIANEFGMDAMQEPENPYKDRPSMSYENQDKARSILLKSLLDPSFFDGLDNIDLTNITKKSYSELIANSDLKMSPEKFMTNLKFEDRVHQKSKKGDHVRIQYSFKTTESGMTTANQLSKKEIEEDLKDILKKNIIIKMYSVMKEGEGYDGTDFGDDLLEEPLDVNYSVKLNIFSSSTMQSERGSELIPYHDITVVIQILLHSASAEAEYSSDVAKQLAESRELQRSQVAKSKASMDLVIRNWRQSSWKVPTAYKCDNVAAESRPSGSESDVIEGFDRTVADSYSYLRNHYQNLVKIKNEFKRSKYATFIDFLSKDQAASKYKRMIEEAYVESLNIQEDATLSCKTINLHDEVKESEKLKARRIRRDQSGRATQRRR